MTKEDIQAKLQTLRELWKKTPPEDISGRKLLESRAKLLRLALYKLEHKNGWF